MLPSPYIMTDTGFFPQILFFINKLPFFLTRLKSTFFFSFDWSSIFHISGISEIHFGDLEMFSPRFFALFKKSFLATLIKYSFFDCGV